MTAIPIQKILVLIEVLEVEISPEEGLEEIGVIVHLAVQIHTTQVVLMIQDLLMTQEAQVLVTGNC